MNKEIKKLYIAAEKANLFEEGIDIRPRHPEGNYSPNPGEGFYLTETAKMKTFCLLLGHCT